MTTTMEERTVLTIRCREGHKVGTVTVTADAEYMLNLTGEAVGTRDGHVGTATRHLLQPDEKVENFLGRCRCRVDNIVSSGDIFPAIQRGESHLFVRRW